MTAFWTTRQDPYGAFHLADPTRPDYWPETLFVFVHGWLGHHERTWGPLPEMMRDGLKHDADVLTFRYPTWPWFRSSIALAASQLSTSLRLRESYQHYVFVTHSTGGLVTKELFRSEFRELGLFGDKASRQLEATLTFRSPLILNVAVPHEGASPIARATLKPAFRAFSTVYSRLSPALRVLTGGAYGLGYNSLIPALVDDRSWLEDPADHLAGLEREYLDGIEALDELGLPRPQSIEILAGDDVAIERYGLNRPASRLDTVPRSDMREGEGRKGHYVIRGTHQSVKLPTDRARKTPMVDVATRLATRLADRSSVVVARGTIDRVQQLNRQVVDQTGAGSTGTGAPRVFADQQTAIDRLTRLVQTNPGARRPVLVTGPTGVGKSTVLRCFASRLASAFLGGLDGAPIPIVVPLQQFTLDGADDSDDWDRRSPGATPWEVLAAHWVAWVARLVDDTMDRAAWSPERRAAGPTVTTRWIRQRLAVQPVVLILDAVDEFLLNNPDLTLRDLRLLLDDLINQLGDNPRLMLVVGIRSDQPGLRSALGDLAAVVDIQRPTLTEAERLVPHIRAWAEDLDSAGKDILLTPLIFMQLPQRPAVQDDVTARPVRTKRALLEIALLTLVRNSGLSGFEIPGDLQLTTDSALAAMEIIAWRLYVGLGREISAPEVTASSAEDAENWRQHLAATGQAEPDLMAAFAAMTSERVAELVLSRTVFLPTGGNRYRFAHREWEDALLARYVERCFRRRHTRELRHHAMRRDIFRLAAERLGSVTFTQEDVDRVLRLGSEVCEFVPGNFFAFVSVNPQAQLDGPAVALFFSWLRSASPLVACTLLNGFANRALLAVPGDHTGQMAAAELRGALDGFLQRRRDDPISASEAWCFSIALATAAGHSAPDVGPYVPLTPDEELHALGFICDTSRLPYRLTKDHRSFQRAFLELAGALRHESGHRVVATVHYLYYLALAHRHRAYVAESGEELHRILSSNSDEARIVERYDVVPQARTIFKRCQALYREAIDAPTL